MEIPVHYDRVTVEALESLSPSTKIHRERMTTVVGMQQKIIRALMWINILLVAVKKFRNLFIAVKKIKQLRRLRNEYRNQKVGLKYSRIGGEYYVSYNTPAWPSEAFDRYISHLLNRTSSNQQPSLNTLVFAITKKCGFQCEHCCEWENLNKQEVLSKEDLLLIILRFQQMGVSQVQLSGGEPLNRFNDILFLLDNIDRGTDFWLYTTGYQLTPEKVRRLKKHGLRGITISLDDYIEENHDRFRGRQGSFRRALQAAQYAIDARLAVCFSLCATKQFINMGNLMNYAEMARRAGASFIQILEPKAVGHYANQPVTLNTEHIKILELFFEKINYQKAYASYPIVSYHGYYSRRVGCSGAGKDYVYVDTDGDVHNCPFCQRKLFSAFDDDLFDRISGMKLKGCSAHSLCSTIK